MDREKKKVKVEVERGVVALERLLGLAAFDKLTFEEKLLEAQKSCEKMKENSSRSSGDRLFSNVGVKTEEGYAEVCVEHTKMVYEKNQIIIDLKEKLKGFEMKVVEMDKEVEELQQQKWKDNRILDEMRGKLEESERMEEILREKNREASQTLEQLRHKLMATEMQIMRTDENTKKISRKKLEADRTVEELRRQNLEASKIVEELRRQLLDYEVQKKTSDRAMDETRRKEKESVLYVEELKRKNLEASRTVVELRRQNLTVDKAAEVHRKRFENLVPMAEELANYLRMEVDDLVILKNKFVATEGGEDLRPCLGNGTKRGAENIIESPGMRTSVERRCRGLPEKGPHEQLMTETRCHRETTPSSVAPTDIIEIIDCDDETNTGRNAYVSDLCTNLGETEMIYEKSESGPSSNRKDKQNGIDCSEFSLIIPKRKRSKLGRIEDNKSPIEDNNSTDNLHSDKLHETCLYGDDMLKAFEEDDELCMHAVCALYRNQMSASKSTTSGVFSHFETMGGCDLAEYLIDGDPELRLRKAVAEVKQHNPDVLNQCRSLAIEYASYFIAMASVPSSDQDNRSLSLFL